MRCPDCGKIVTESDYMGVSWCDHCGWGDQPDETTELSDMLDKCREESDEFDKWYTSISKDLSKVLGYIQAMEVPVKHKAMLNLLLNDLGERFPL